MQEKTFLKVIYCSTKMKHLSLKSGCGTCIPNLYKHARFQVLVHVNEALMKVNSLTGINAQGTQATHNNSGIA